MESPGVVDDYDPTWPMVFEDLRARLAPALVGIATSIEHVGSTAVPGLAAKPIIDMDVVVPDAALVPAAIARLETLGYVHQGDLGISGREAFRPPIGGPYHHLYVVVEGTRPHRDHVDLRDYLRRHPDEAARYATRKQEVAHLLQTNREAYLTAKAGLVEEMLVQARGTVEETFHGREHRDRVVRIGDTVRRPTGPGRPRGLRE
ncbi:MAG TPA: GrpB family protein [Actinomycetota bacterium]|nr:GrpB family protein [Actinomycetota bacterium]